jgi:glycosyltransferase involved in cell wall biosynthesis
MTQKPRILLIPDIAWWVIGEMAKQIAARFGDKYDFYLVPGTVFDRRPDLLRAIVPAVDMVHCLSEERVELFRDFDPATLPPIATWIHHVIHWEPFMQTSVEMSAALTTCTDGWKQYLDQHTRDRVPVTVVRHGVDTHFFQPTATDRTRFGIPQDRFVVGFLGSKDSDGHGRKGTDILLDVTRKAAALLPNLHIVLGGPGWDKELAGLHAQGISASATGYIRKADLPALYSALDVYLLTSRVEGGPCTVFEAMACETAVVSTRVGAVPDLIVDGVNGFSTEVDDTQALVSAIVQLGQSPEKRAAIGKAGRASMAHHAWATVLTPLEVVYDELILRKRSKGLPAPGPSWMSDPEALMRSACAADALLYLIPRVRNGSMSLPKALGMLREMLSTQPTTDIVKGLALARGLTYRAGQ